MAKKRRRFHASWIERARPRTACARSRPVRSIEEALSVTRSRIPTTITLRRPNAERIVATVGDTSLRPARSIGQVLAEQGLARGLYDPEGLKPDPNKLTLSTSRPATSSRHRSNGATTFPVLASRCDRLFISGSAANRTAYAAIANKVDTSDVVARSSARSWIAQVGPIPSATDRGESSQSWQRRQCTTGLTSGRSSAAAQYPCRAGQGAPRNQPTRRPTARLARTDRVVGRAGIRRRYRVPRETGGIASDTTFRDIGRAVSELLTAS